MRVNQSGRRQPSRRSPCFEPTDPPARPIGREPPPATRRTQVAVDGNRGASCTSTAGSDCDCASPATVFVPRGGSAHFYRFQLTSQSRPHAGKDLTSWGECLMTRLRYHHMLAGTALAVILAAIPLGGLALDRSKTAPGAGSPAEQTSTEVSSPSAATIEPVTTAEAATTTEAAPTTATNSEPAAAVASTVAAEQAPVVDPLASLDPADRPIAEKIRDLFAAPSDRIFANKKERAAVEAFYQSRNYAPLWLDKGLENVRATSAIARLKNADSDGLEAS